MRPLGPLIPFLILALRSASQEAPGAVTTAPSTETGAPPPTETVVTVPTSQCSFSAFPLPSQTAVADESSSSKEGSVAHAGSNGTPCVGSSLLVSEDDEKRDVRLVHQVEYPRNDDDLTVLSAHQGAGWHSFHLWRRRLTLTSEQGGVVSRCLFISSYLSYRALAKFSQLGFDLGEPIICGDFDLEDALKRENEARMARETSHFDSREEDPDVEEATPENTRPTHQAVRATQNKAAPQALTRNTKKMAKKRVRDRAKRRADAVQSQSAVEPPLPTHRMLQVHHTPQRPLGPVVRWLWYPPST
ncbi:hypothetical protein B0H14DRAFT_2628273 [Mycena olivaceomarginata]|nr:hypothetical protein B0H14DRAFT_2628273 [Mycena olivaceomarginata]